MQQVITQLAPSVEQLPAVATLDRDVLVNAGAGSGKTRTLVARFLATLAAGVPLRAIAAVTFTRKAALEMRNRVRTEIGRLREQPGLDGAQRDVWERAASALDAARIGTIHMLCAEILRAHPAEAVLDPGFAVLEETDTLLARQDAVRAAMAAAAEDPRTLRLYETLTPAALQEVLGELLNKRLEAGRAFAALPDSAADILALWEAAVGARVRSVLVLTDVAAARAELRALAARKEFKAALAKGDKLADSILALQPMLAAIERALDGDDWHAVLPRLAELKVNKNAKGAKGNWPDVDAVRGVAFALRDAYDNHIAPWLGQGLDRDADRAWAEVLPALRGLHTGCVAHYEAWKRAQRGLDFDDLEARAVELLDTNAAVRVRWRAELARLLVDEFQDTNERQRRLCELLAGGRAGARFFVGDPKQSIYRFRGADVTVFERERAELRARGGLEVPLSRSYRAHPALIALMNGLAQPVLGEADPLRPFRVPFSALSADPARTPGPGFAPPHVEGHFVLGTRDDAEDPAAAIIARRISALMATMAVQTPDGPRRLAYDDIAVLCRARASFAPFEDAFEAAGIPYITGGGAGFHKRPEVRDLINALRAIRDPQDELAAFGVLRSPAYGATDGELLALRVHWLEGGDLQAALDDPALPIPAASRAALLDAWRAVLGLHAQAGRAGAAALLRDYLARSGYVAGLLGAGQVRAARNVDKFVEDAQALGVTSISEFLERIDALDSPAVRIGEARATPEGAVHVLTIHAAKGLEYPVVIVADLGRKPNSQRGLILDDRLGPMLSLGDSDMRSAAHALAAERAAAEELAEGDRLLYVAITRARERLILSGLIRVGKTKLAAAGWLKQLAESGGIALPADPGGDDVIDVPHAVAGQPVQLRFYPPSAAAGDSPGAPGDGHDDGEPGRLLDPLTPTQAGRQPETLVARVSPAQARPRAPAFIVGELVHAALELWRFEGAALAAQLHELARTAGLADAARAQDGVARALRLLARFRGSPLAARMDAASRRLHEVDYTLPDGAIGRIDALFQDPAGWHVVDFKTERLRQDQVDPEVERYASQLARYRDALGHLGIQIASAQLCFMDVAGAVVLRDVPA